MKTTCDRCNKVVILTVISTMNRDNLCMNCKCDEQSHPRYREAREAEAAACCSGNFNYPGLFADQKYPFNKEEINMPYAWIESDVALEYKGVKIYHVYKNDDTESGVRDFWFGWDANCTEANIETVFDVRKLINYTRDLDILDILREAIDQGFLTQDGPVN